MSLYRRLGRPQGLSGRVRKISPPQGFDPRTIQPVASRYTDYAIPSHYNNNNNNGKLKEKFGSCIRKTFDRFTTKDSYSTWNITHNTESAAVWSLKPERWGSPLVQEKYREEKACDNRHPYRITIIIIGKPNIKELHKTAILGAAHTSESIDVEVESTFNTRNGIICTTNCNCAIASTLYTPRNMCFWYVFVSTVHRVAKYYELFTQAVSN